MIELDGIEYDVNTPLENASELVNYINEYCASNNVTNSEGEVISIDAVDSNPLYLLCYGVGYLASIIQQLIYSNGCMFNLQAASDRQILSIASVAGLSRKEASYTTINAAVTAALAEPCTITKTLTATVNSSGTTLVFSPAFETTIEAATTTNIVLVCNVTGSYSIPAGTITGFDENPTGFSTMVTLDSIPGNDRESLSALRERLKERGETYTLLDRAASAISDLDGVAKCSIYFNYSPDLTTVVGNTNLDPRTALLFVQGYDDRIAETFYQYLTCLTQRDADGTAVQQDYITNAGQHIPVYIIPPVLVPVYIRLYLSAEVTVEDADRIKTAITALAASQEIAASLSSTQVINAVQDTTTDTAFTILGAEVSLTSGTDYTIYVQPEPYQLIQFIADNIQILTVT